MQNIGLTLIDMLTYQTLQKG